MFLPLSSHSLIFLTTDPSVLPSYKLLLDQRMYFFHLFSALLVNISIRLLLLHHGTTLANAEFSQRIRGELSHGPGPQQDFSQWLTDPHQDKTQGAQMESIPTSMEEPNAFCEENYCCHISNSTTCSFSSLPKKNQPAYIFPYGTSHCLDQQSPYRFEVFKGSSKKVLLYFQGGGGYVMS